MNKILTALLVVGVGSLALGRTETYDTESTPWSLKYITVMRDHHMLHLRLHRGDEPSAEEAEKLARHAIDMALLMKNTAAPTDMLMSYVSMTRSQGSDKIVKMPDGSDCLIYFVKSREVMTASEYEKAQKEKEEEEEEK